MRYGKDPEDEQKQSLLYWDIEALISMMKMSRTSCFKREPRKSPSCLRRLQHSVGNRQRGTENLIFSQGYLIYSWSLFQKHICAWPSFAKMRVLSSICDCEVHNLRIRADIEILALVSDLDCISPLWCSKKFSVVETLSVGKCCMLGVLHAWCWRFRHLPNILGTIWNIDFPACS